MKDKRIGKYVRVIKFEDNLADYWFGIVVLTNKVFHLVYLLDFLGLVHCSTSSTRPDNQDVMLQQNCGTGVMFT